MLGERYRQCEPLVPFTVSDYLFVFPNCLQHNVFAITGYRPLIVFGMNSPNEIHVIVLICIE